MRYNLRTNKVVPLQSNIAIYLHVRFIVTATVNSETFARILYSRIALKDILKTICQVKKFDFGMIYIHQ